jgi:two-component system OmpR family sensor kinase
MRRLVSDLLTLAQVDSGRVAPRAGCDLSEIARDAIAEVRPVAPNHTISLDEPDAVVLEGNGDELHQLVRNLVENAVSHTPAGTTVRVALTRRGETARLDVSDDGPGLPAGLAEKVFDRFVRASGPADTAGSEGTGLGLAIVRAVAEAHGGRVWAGRSAAGGAAFHVELPLAASSRELQRNS